MTYRMDVTVDLPSTGKYHINQGKYVQYYTGYHMDQKRKKSVDNRITIGRLVDGNPAKMYPNKTYFEIFGKEERTARIADYLNIGPYLALHAAADKIGILDCLEKAFPDLKDDLFALAMMMVDDQSSTAQEFEFWGFHNYCGLKEPLSSSTISRIYKAVSSRPDACEYYMELFKDSFHKAVPEAKEGIMAFDSTNMNTACLSNKYAEYGKAKINNDLPITNLALMVDETTGITLAYETYNGSLLDKTETPVSLEKIKELGYKECHFAMDGGYASKDTVEAFRNGFTFSVMIPEGFTIYKQLYVKYRKKLVDNQSLYISSENAYGIKLPSIEVFGGKYIGYLYYDPEMAKQQTDNLHEMIASMKATAAKRERYTQKLADKYRGYLIIKNETDINTGKNFTIEEDTASIQKMIDKTGIFLVVSNADFTLEKMLRITRARDKAEKANKRIKSHFDMTAMYTHSTATYEGKTFLGIISQQLVESYRWYIKNILSRKTSETTMTTLGEMRKYMMYRKADGSWMYSYAATKKQKQIAQCLDLTENGMRAYIRNLTL